MQIWVDADACPGVIKEILFRAAKRHALQVTLVANQMLRVPPSAKTLLKLKAPLLAAELCWQSLPSFP